MQIISILGNLTKDAELKSTTRQGVKNEFIAFTVACNENKGDEESATFYDVTCAKSSVLEYLKKGQKVAVVGRFRFVVTKDQNGKEYPHLNVGAFSVELAGRSSKSEAPAEAEDIPQE